MKKIEFIELVSFNDVAFKFENQEYYIFQGNNSCICGQYSKGDSTEFNKYDDLLDNIEDMMKHWIFCNGLPLESILDKIIIS